MADDKMEKPWGAEGKRKRAIQKEETKVVDSEVRRAVVAGNEKKVSVAGAQRGRVRGMHRRQRKTQGLVLEAALEAPHFLNLLLFCTVSGIQLDRIKKN